MISVYLDESGTHSPDYTVLAGFAGKRRTWEKVVPAWKSGLGERPFLHVSSMPLIRESEREWLKRLAIIPYRHRLVPVYGAVCANDYMDMVKGTVAEVHSHGVCICIAPIVNALIEWIPSDERIEFIFETSPLDFYIERMMMMIAKFPGIRRQDGKSIISKWSFVPKGETCLLEPSDYLANHLYNREIDPTSTRTLWTSPIAEGRTLLGGKMARDRVRNLFTHLARPEFSKDIPRTAIKRYRKGIRNGSQPDPWTKRFGGKS